MSFIIRCDAPGCASKVALWGAVPAGWAQTHNRAGEVVHACATVGHVAAAQNTASRIALAAVV